MPTNEEINLKVNIDFRPERVNRAAEAVRKLSERLSVLLDDDQFNALEPELQAIAECLVSARTNVVPASAVELSDSQLLDALDKEIAARDLRWVARNDGYPAIGTASGAERHGVRDAMRALLVLMQGCLCERGRIDLTKQKADPAPLHLGACITEGKLHATVLRSEVDQSITVVASAELDIEDLKNGGCHAVMRADEPAAYYVRQVHEGHPPEFNTVDEFSNGMGGGDALYRKPQYSRWAVLPEDARECLTDVVSHHGDFVSACEFRKHTDIAHGDCDSASYWQHQVHVLTRMKAQAEGVIGLAPIQLDVGS